VFRRGPAAHTNTLLSYIGENGAARYLAAVGMRSLWTSEVVSAHTYKGNPLIEGGRDPAAAS
jgi:hypothetical protein